jgi:hypothetical protein
MLLQKSILLAFKQNYFYKLVKENFKHTQNYVGGIPPFFQKGARGILEKKTEYFILDWQDLQAEKSLKSPCPLW